MHDEGLFAVKLEHVDSKLLVTGTNKQVEIVGGCVACGGVLRCEAV